MAQLAFLLQNTIDPSVTEVALRTALLADHDALDPDKLTIKEKDNDAAPGEESPLVLDYDGAMIALMATPAQIGGDLAEIAAHSRLWPKDQPVPVDYGAHTIVTIFEPGDDGHEAALAQAVLLSRVVATMIGLSETVKAVYWGSANHVIFPPLFRDLALSALPDPLLPAWIAFNVGARPDGVMTGHTLGLSQLGVMDIEIPETTETASDVFEHLTNIGNYQLDHGPVIADGHTIGETAEATLIAHHTPSALGGDNIVLTLEFLSSQPRKKKGLFRR